MFGEGAWMIREALKQARAGGTILEYAAAMRKFLCALNTGLKIQSDVEIASVDIHMTPLDWNLMPWKQDFNDGSSVQKENLAAFLSATFPPSKCAQASCLCSNLRGKDRDPEC